MRSFTKIPLSLRPGNQQPRRLASCFGAVSDIHPLSPTTRAQLAVEQAVTKMKQHSEDGEKAKMIAEYSTLRSSLGPSSST